MRKCYHFIHVAPCFVDLTRETGGVANVVRRICLILRQRGYSVTLICTNTELGKIVADSRSYISDEGIFVHIVSQNKNPLTGPYRNVTKAMKQACETTDSSLVLGHVHTCFSCQTEAAMSFFSKNSIPFVFSPHGKLSPNMFGQHRLAKTAWWWFIARKLVMQSRLIGLLARNESILFKRLGISAPTIVIPNGFVAEAVEYHEIVEIPEKYILYLGYLDPRKQPEFLVKSFAKAQASKTHKLVLAGPDSYGFKKRINEVAVYEGVADSVIFWGGAYEAMKWLLLKRASFLCLPSLGEGHPIVLCEALGAGIPSIYSADCNFPEIAERGAGILLENFDASSWAQAIDDLAFDENKRVSMCNSSRLMASEFTWEAVIDKWENAYLECLQQRSPI